MEKLDSLQSTWDHIKKFLSDGEQGISTHLISGKFSGGKKKIMDMAQTMATEHGYLVYRFPGNITQESMPYQPFNYILNAMYDTVEERGMNEIIKKFNNFFTDNKGLRILVIIEGIERLNTSSQDLFLYLSRTALKQGFSLIGTYNEPKRNQEYTPGFNFIIVSATEPQIHIINLREPNYDDARFYTQMMGYKLPENFTIDLFRLSSGDLSTINYALKYYEDIGIINDRKEVNDALFRFLPIPPAIDDYYAKKIADLSETEMKVAGTMALSGEELDLDVISRITFVSKSDLYKVMESLDSNGIIAINNFKYKISGRRMTDIIRSKVSDVRKLDLADQLINSSSFDELSLQTKLNILRERGLYDKIGEIIRSKWKQLINSFVSPMDLIAFLDLVENRLDSDIKRYALLIRCNSLYFVGKFDQSLKCFRENDFSDIAGKEPELKVASALIYLGRNDEAATIIERLLADKSLSPEERVMAMVAKGSYLLRTKKSSQALIIASEAMEIAKAYSVNELIDEVLTTMATANADIFKFDKAKKLYGEALEIERKRGKIRQMNRNLHDLAIIESFEGNFQKALDMLKELLENTYINGDIGIRTYAVYNIMDILHIIGKNQESQSYEKTMDGLLDIVQDNDIRFIYNRYIASFYTEALDFAKALPFSDRAVELSSLTENPDWKGSSESLRHLIMVKMGKIPELDLKYFITGFNSLEDFIPLYLGFWSNIFVIRGMDSEALVALKASEKYSEEMGDFSSKLTTLLNKIIYFLATEKFDEILKLNPLPKDTGVMKFDYSVRALNAAMALKSGDSDVFHSESKKIVSDLWDGSMLYNVIFYPFLILGLAKAKFADDDSVIDLIKGIITGKKTSTEMSKIAEIFRR
ncbi:MAG: tetratricopeptide repeat protein [Candidatus Thermoplasmatota archaeon]|nr:tetratricopeptide repeat protein [Candidatus Thermoplasmatota archaeon]